MKKALSIFLSIVMLLTMSAELNITARAEQSVKSSFDEATGTLTFTGKGTVSASSYDYGNIGDKIRKVIVNVGIDEIQSYAFSKADKLQSVIIYDQTCQISAQGILPIGKKDVTFYGFDKSKTQEWALNHKYPFKYIYTITFLKRNNSVSKIIYALDGETAQEIIFRLMLILTVILKMGTLSLLGNRAYLRQQAINSIRNTQNFVCVLKFK